MRVCSPLLDSFPPNSRFSRLRSSPHSSPDLNSAHSVPTILRSLPYRPGPLLVQGQNRRKATAHQIFVHVSITKPGIDRNNFNKHTPVFLALLDTGCNGNLSIRQKDLLALAKLSPDQLPKIHGFGRTVNGRRVLVRNADIWLYFNKPGFADMLPDKTPFPLRCENNGVSVYQPASVRQDRPPLLGLGAIDSAGLSLIIHGNRTQLSLRTAPRFWFS